MENWGVVFVPFEAKVVKQKEAEVARQKWGVMMVVEHWPGVSG